MSGHWVTTAVRAARRAARPVKAVARRLEGAQAAQGEKVRLALARRVWAAFKEEKEGQALALHLGCGTKRFEGWCNIDIDGAPELIWDLRRQLPFIDDGVVDAVYHEHFLEHLGRADGFALLCDCRRVMRRGAVMRVAVPDLSDVLAGYARGARDEPGVFDGEARLLYGDTLLRSRGELLDISMRAWGHRYLYDEDDLCNLLRRAGFALVQRVAYRQSTYPGFAGIETRPPEQSSLIVEAVCG